MTTTVRKPGAYELPRGTAVGKYEILRKIATGGMAEIYLARARGTAGFEKLVVLKRILPNVAEDPNFVQMFLDEARLAATLQHPHIADVYDVGEADGAYFFTMEFIHGQDVRTIRMAARARKEQVPLNVALSIVHSTASALDYAHDKTGPDGQLLGLVHRDVSASNVLVSYDGAIKLVDFGIARATSRQHKTQTGTLKGKIPYMSPEQAKGLPLDRRSDLFSLGVVLYELTVGRRPFRGDSDFAIMDQIVYQGATAPTQVVADYPPELEAIVMKLLQRAPSQRYANAEEALHDLDAFIQAERLWMSSKLLGKYMRTLFADKIAAWQEAEQHGVPFVQHVAETITANSQRSDLVTPPTAQPGLPPRQTEPLPVAPAPLPTAPTSSRRRLLWIAVAALVVSGAIGGYLVVTGRESAPAPARVELEPSPPVAAPPTPPPVAAPPTPPVATTTTTPPPVAATTTPPTTPPPPPVAATTTTPPPPKHLRKPVRVAKPKPKPTTPDKPDQPEPPKEPTWDPNSPFLPQQ